MNGIGNEQMGLRGAVEIFWGDLKYAVRSLAQAKGSRPRWCSRWRSGSAPMPLFSPWSAGFCCRPLVNRDESTPDLYPAERAGARHRKCRHFRCRRSRT